MWAEHNDKLSHYFQNQFELGTGNETGPIILRKIIFKVEPEKIGPKEKSAKTWKTDQTGWLVLFIIFLKINNSIFCIVF